MVMDGTWTTAWLAGAGVVFALATLLWALSVRLRNVAIVDVFWGPAFLAAALTYRAYGPAAEPRHWLLLGLVAVWALRLGGYIWWRSRGAGEDYRYAAMRAGHGPRFWWVSLFTVFWLQAALVALISAPLLFAQTQPTVAGWRAVDALAVGLWLLGFAFEAGGDWQMLRFKANPNHRGRVMDRGFWRYTRHPNYFGDACQWWAFWLLATAAPGGVWTVFAPLLMTILLLQVSGVALLEKTIAERRPEYRSYIERTPAFLPWFPRPATASASEPAAKSGEVRR
jgi:steroid 5-alpha reductase family enzyme